MSLCTDIKNESDEVVSKQKRRRCYIYLSRLEEKTPFGEQIVPMPCFKGNSRLYIKGRFCSRWRMKKENKCKLHPYLLIKLTAKGRKCMLQYFHIKYTLKRHCKPIIRTESD